jgi:hypothetical protein
MALGILVFLENLLKRKEMMITLEIRIVMIYGLEKFIRLYPL